MSTKNLTAGQNQVLDDLFQRFSNPATCMEGLSHAGLHEALNEFQSQANTWEWKASQLLNFTDTRENAERYEALRLHRIYLGLAWSVRRELSQRAGVSEFVIP